MPGDLSSPFFDPALGSIQNLSWLPWVGSAYDKLLGSERVLVVAESQTFEPYEHPEFDPKEKARLADPALTREMVANNLVGEEWPPGWRSRTLSTLDRLLYKPRDRARFWSKLALHHFVQSPLCYQGPIAAPPTNEDLLDGWEVLVSVVKVLRPRHILVVGLEPSHCFNLFMEGRGRPFTPVAPKSPFHLAASFEFGDDTCEIHFIKDCGKSFRTELWRGHLERTAASLMSCFRVFAARGRPTENGEFFHVLGCVLTPFDLVRGEMEKLELVLLRLARAVGEFTEIGEPAVAYLRVLDARMGLTADDLARKHRVGNEVVILHDARVAHDHRKFVRNMTVGVYNWVRNIRYEGLDWEPSLAEMARKGAAKELDSYIISKDYGGLMRYAKPRHLEFCQFYGKIALERGYR